MSNARPIFYSVSVQAVYIIGTVDMLILYPCCVPLISGFVIGFMIFVLIVSHICKYYLVELRVCNFLLLAHILFYVWM